MKGHLGDASENRNVWIFEHESRRRKMRKGKGFTAVMGCAVLVAGLAILGCGNTNSTDGDGSTDLTSLLDITCIDTCSMAISCIAEQALEDWGFPLPAGIEEKDYDKCMGMCTDPAENSLGDEAMRDCGINCETSTDCNTYFDLDYAGGMLKSYSQFLQMPDIIIKTRYLGEGFE